VPTTTVRTKTTRPLARRAGIVCLIGSLAACSSGTSHTTSTTSSTSRSSTSTPETTTRGTSPLSVREFFAGEGKPLIEFERATKVIATGSPPQKETCLRLTRQVLPKIIASPNSLNPLARRIPDATLNRAVTNDVNLKLIVVLGCSLRTPTTGPGSDPKAWTTVSDFANGVKRLLAPYGIDI